MKKRILIGFSILSICLFISDFLVYADSCPSSNKYAAVNYNHFLVNQYIAGGTYSQASGVIGPVGIKVGPQGVVNSGNNIVTRSIDLVYTTSTCDCLSETATSKVTVTISGSCSNGILSMQVNEVYPASSALVTCTGDDTCPIYTQVYPGSSNNFSMKMNYVNGYTVTQPYTCTNCSGTYSWQLQFLSKPPPSTDVPLVPIASMLELMLLRSK